MKMRTIMYLAFNALPVDIEEMLFSPGAPIDSDEILQAGHRPEKAPLRKLQTSWAGFNWNWYYFLTGLLTTRLESRLSQSHFEWNSLSLLYSHAAADVLTIMCTSQSGKQDCRKGEAKSPVYEAESFETWCLVWEEIKVVTFGRKFEKEMSRTKMYK